jgi:hypothetical protein
MIKSISKPVFAALAGTAGLMLVLSPLGGEEPGTERGGTAAAPEGPIVRVGGDHRTRVLLQNLAPNTVVDCQGARFFLGLADKSQENNYILQVRGSVDTVVKNVEIIGDIPLDTSWNDQYKDNNSASSSTGTASRWRSRTTSGRSRAPHRAPGARIGPKPSSRS